MILPAVAGDLPRIYDACCEQLYAQSKHPLAPVKEVWVRNWTRLLSLNVGVMLLAEEDGSQEVMGAAGGIFFEDMNNGTLRGDELLWYVVPKFRGRALGWTLIKLFWQEARRRGVRVVSSSRLTHNDSNDLLRRFYQSQGFMELETVHVKEL